jgi:hypothetical protein
MQYRKSSVLFRDDRNDFRMVIAIWIVELGKSINFTKVISVINVGFHIRKHSILSVL